MLQQSQEDILRTSASSGSVSGFVCVSCQSEMNRAIKITLTALKIFLKAVFYNKIICFKQ